MTDLPNITSSDELGPSSEVWVISSSAHLSVYLFVHAFIISSIDMASPLHNYLTVDPQTFLANPKNMEIVYTMCKKVSE